MPPEVAATLDFDGDGRADRVVLEGEGRARRLIAYRASAPTRGIVVTHVPDAETFEVSVIEPGTHATACGKGAGRSRDCAAPRFDAKRQTLAYGTAEASLIGAPWDGKGFGAVALSD